MASTIGYLLVELFNGIGIVAVVLILPTIGPLLLLALLSEDLYLAGSILFIITGLVLIGTLISDIILAWADPRIRLGPA